MGRDNHSYVNVGWISGYEKKYYLNGHAGAVKLMMDDIKEQNRICEGIKLIFIFHYSTKRYG